MATKPETLELKGTWEEILQHANELAGRRVRVTVLEPEPEEAAQKRPLKPENQRMLEWLEEHRRTPLTEEELAALDEIEEIRRKERLRFYGPDDAP
jgi:hypothetical protein